MLFWFSLNQQRNKNEKAPIYLRLTFNDKRTEFASGQYIEAAAWDNKQQRVKSRYLDAEAINRILDVMRADIQKHFSLLLARDKHLLTFSGKMVNKDASNASMADNLMTFKVYGDVQVDGSKVTTKSSTPLGAFTMVYDYDNAILHGSLTIDGVELGSANVKGTVEMQVDKQGFYFAGAGQANVQGPLPVGGIYTVGFLMGDHPVDANSNMWQMVNQYMYIKNNCWPAQNKNHLTGFFFAAGKQFLNVSKGFDFVIVSGYVKAIAGVDANIWANFGDGANAGVKVTAYADVNAGLSSCTGTSIEGSLSIHGVLDAYYANSKFNMNATLDNTFGAKVSQYIPFYGTVSKSMSVNALLRGGTGGFSFELSSGGTKAEICQ